MRRACPLGRWGADAWAGVSLACGAAGSVGGRWRERVRSGVDVLASGARCQREGKRARACTAGSERARAVRDAGLQWEQARAAWARHGRGRVSGTRAQLGKERGRGLGWIAGLGLALGWAGFFSISPFSLL